MLPPRDCLDVVAALKSLGCDVAAQRERAFIVCRGAMRLAVVPKMMVLGRAQYQIIASLELDEGMYLKALSAVIDRARSA